ncbi:hypothetical protein Ahy_A02g005417 [Arachis hypogaea]|uniref:Uncharacterized protein n=1 Tax=Arachis hypogaea TaxID=3818 RepID=A0A445E6R1_ARAHY|nr:hypothetical protein Ahy_A02g005417 [Arachis hypogaea]
MVGSSSNASEGKKAKFQHPKCKCGTYAVMQQSGTAKNPDRIFLGCSYYGVNDNDVQGRMMRMEKRLEKLEFKIEDEYEAK